MSSGTSVPAAEALLAASGPATPSMAPWPNSSGSRREPLLDRVRQQRRQLGAAGRAARRAGSRWPCRAATASTIAPSRRALIHSDALERQHSSSPVGAAASDSVSPTANRPIATMTGSIPSSRYGMPKVSRASPLRRSMPTSPSVDAEQQAQPAPRCAIARAASRWRRTPATISAKYSAGPNASASCTIVGARHGERRACRACRRRSCRSPRWPAPRRRGRGAPSGGRRAR